MWKDLTGIELSYCPGIGLEGLRKAMIIFIRVIGILALRGI
jgi:hypothetical protein